MSFYLFIFFLPDTDVIMTLVQYIVSCITPSFQLCRKKHLAEHWTTHNWCIHWPVAFSTQNMNMCQRQIF